jgi:hypothetical protein
VKPGEPLPPLQTARATASSPQQPAPSSTLSPPWWVQHQGPRAQQAPSSVQGAVAASTRTGSAPLSAGRVAQASLNYAFIGLFLIWGWFPLLRSLFTGMGAAPADAPWFAVSAYVAACIGLGYRRTKRESQPQPARSSTTFTSGPTTAPPTSTTVPVAGPPKRPSPFGSSTSGAATAVVGSRIRQIYHRPSCKWAYRISSRNRVAFNSVASAKNAGYRACGVCSP